jgi:hypothetical protein
MPGNAKRGLAEVKKTAELAPLAFVVRLSNGADFKTQRGWQVRQMVPNMAFDFAMSIQLQRHAQFEDDAVVADIASDDVLRTHLDKARRFSKLVADGVHITIDAFLDLEARRIENAA